MLSDVAELFGEVAEAPARDRRITRRLVDLWARAARGQFPSWAAMQEMDFGEDQDWLFVVDLEKSVGFPYFIFIGDRLAKLSDVHLSGEDDWTLTVLDKATADVYAAVAGEAPHFREDTLILCDGRRLLFRSVTAPLADDGTTITHVIGAATGRLAVEVEPTLKLVE
ncbi:hypothetical protein PUV54_11620 [Hyphococcus flavus]|uniref:PAS domain-containing protein n=1 Tax=Hyphococcus flavus TaxID=1866326 RepID=A0AAE9ZDF2_9PROT|nr:hypothetical protein [Hyphococcus flavus]WDI30603.1 hypothetical protein PUV54_11620 [Hyphococcus flavus]